jgi:hypothetical protein
MRELLPEFPFLYETGQMTFRLEPTPTTFGGP